ncbi:hypothetical protein HL658_01740 [Azospirillum sp. RWY-5-1]|nr:hypothetical protein [Azospirillum oleiclasticum]
MPTPFDDTMVEAIRLLTDAVKTERVPGIVEFRLLERALEEVARNPTTTLLAHASAAFRALDRDHQILVMKRAETMAHRSADLRRMTNFTLEGAHPRPPHRAPKPKQAASPFLSALNGPPHRERSGA